MKHSKHSTRIAFILSHTAIAAIALVFFLRFLPSFSPLLLARAEVDLSVPYRYISIGWIDWAALQLKEMAERPLPDEELLIALGLAHESLEEYEEALSVYDKVATIFAHDAAAVGRAKALAANVNMQLGRFQVARELFLESNRLLPDQAFVLFGLGVLASGDGDLETALDWFDRSMEANPNWIDLAVKAAAVHLRLGDAVTAVAILRPRESRAGRDADFHLHLGTAYATLAEANANAGLDPQEIEALASAGVVGDDIGPVLSELALHALDRTRQLAPEHPGLPDLERLINRIPFPKTQPRAISTY